MRKKFNITGTCIPKKHYMVDISHKINILSELISNGDYLVINKPRQFGKTTTLYLLESTCKYKYDVISMSFEGSGDDLFSTEKVFCSSILSIFSKSVQFANSELYQLIQKFDNNISNFLELSNAITNICSEANNPVVLIIDEIDKSSNSKIFLQFLGMLRAKYLAREVAKDNTFQSVILAGLHDVRNLKLSIRDEKDSTFNSPWNIATKFEVDMSFSAIEIQTMLEDYCTQTDIKFDVVLISKIIYDYTNGYPYLVCDICKIIDEKLKDWSESSVIAAIKQIVKEKNTLFEDVIKNIENDEDLKSWATDILIYGKTISYNQFAHEKGVMYGIFNYSSDKLVIHNRIFEICIYNYLISTTKSVEKVNNIMESETNQFIKNNGLDMEKILLKFQTFMYEEYRNEDISFYEKHGRLIFLAFLKPILNGKGFYFVEAQTRENKRMDIVITYGTEKYIVELKLWNGQAYQETGKIQLCDYLNIQEVQKGYLVTFKFEKSNDKKGEWLEIADKKLFEIII